MDRGQVLKASLDGVRCILLQGKHHQIHPSSVNRFPGPLRCSLKPAAQARSHHLDLKGQSFARQPEPAFESQHLVLTHETRKQLFHSGAVQCCLDLHTTTDHLHMAVIMVLVIMVLVIMVVMPMVMLMIQAEHNSGVNRTLRHRQHSCSRTQFRLQLVL